VGDASDIVEKEMYTFLDKGNRSVTLRPEGTAGVLRAVLENGLNNQALPLKLMYVSSCYRYEKPQSGRYREFFQFGAEIFGAASSLADAQLICVAKSIIDRLGIKGVSLEINSIGCQSCRQKYNEEIKAYFTKNKEKLCPTCQNRLERNPMRILDCKNPDCAEICKSAPVIIDYICGDCSEHFESLKNYLKAVNIECKINPKIVRGLDYYSRTVFEFICDNEGSPITVCGGGRYDGLSELLGGPTLPAIGFGMGIERVLMIMEKQGVEFLPPSVPEVYIASLDDDSRLKAFELCELLKKSSVSAEVDIVCRNLKSQMKYANKIGAVYTMVIGSEETETNRAKIKEMKTGKEYEISIDEGFIKSFMSVQFDKNKF
jgi:histidyl-tRNA synthetase